MGRGITCGLLDTAGIILTRSLIHTPSYGSWYHLQATSWSDVEADLPLYYTYYADGLLLVQATRSSALHVRTL